MKKTIIIAALLFLALPLQAQFTKLGGGNGGGACPTCTETDQNETITGFWTFQNYVYLEFLDANESFEVFDDHETGPAVSIATDYASPSSTPALKVEVDGTGGRGIEVLGGPQIAAYIQSSSTDTSLPTMFLDYAGSTAEFPILRIGDTLDTDLLTIDEDGDIRTDGNLTVQNVTVNGTCTGCGGGSTTYDVWGGTSPASSGTATVVVGVAALSVRGTANRGDDASGPALTYTSGTTANGAAGTAGWESGVGAFQLRYLPDLTVRVRDTSESNFRVWVGFSPSPSSLYATASPAVALAAFRYDSATDGGVWKACTNPSGGTISCTSTGVSFTSGSMVTMRVKVESTTSIKFYIGGTLVHTATTNLPISTDAMNWNATKTTTEAVAKNFSLYNFYMSSAVPLKP